MQDDDLQQDYAQTAPMASLLNIVDGSTVGVLMVGIQGQIVSANPYSLHLLGLYEEDVLQKNIASLFDVQTAERLAQLFHYKNLDKTAFVNGVECLYHGHDNASKNGFLVVRPHPQHKDTYWFILSDRTEIKNLRQQVDVLQKNIPATTTDSSKVVPEQVALISHELRSPLNAIAGYAELMSSEPFGALSPEYKDYLNKLQSASKHAVHVVNDLLNYSQFQEKGFENQPTIQNIEHILNEAKNICLFEASQKYLDIHITILPQTPQIHLDGKLLLQALINLLSNAVKYSDDHEQVQVIAGLTKTGRMMIEITNYGKGFTAEQLDVILKPYGRVNTQDKIIGTGLGLPLAKQLIDVMQGQFMIESVPNEKTRARILFEKDKIIESVAS